MPDSHERYHHESDTTLVRGFDVWGEILRLHHIWLGSQLNLEFLVRWLIYDENDGQGTASLCQWSIRIDSAIAGWKPIDAPQVRAL